MSFTLEAPGYDLAKTLKCGQMFRYRELGSDDFMVWSKDQVCRVRKHSGVLIVDTDGEGSHDYWIRFFNATLEPGELERLMSQNAVLREAYQYSKGTRILRQYPFECLIEFIISQQKRIPQIQSALERLCTLCGPALSDGSCGFPEPRLITPIIVEQLRLGYRGPYVANAAADVADGNLVLEDYTADKVTYFTAMQRLQRLMGVGVKVANCVALFSLGFTNAFPEDTHIIKVMQLPEMKDFRPEDCGEYAGYVQQYLYNYALYNGY